MRLMSGHKITRWNKELIVKSILERHKKGKPLNYQSVVDDDEKLTGAARRHFGSWDEAMNSVGFSQDEYKNPQGDREEWNKGKIISRTKKHMSDGKSLNPHEVQKYDNRLYSATTYHFGSWEKLMLHIGLDYDSIKKTVEWDEESLIEEIKEAYEKGADLSDNTVSALRGDLYSSSISYFGSWKNAITESGIDYKDVRRSTSWNKEKIIELTQKAHESGVSLSQLRQIGILRQQEIRKFFSNVEKLYAEAGIDIKKRHRKNAVGEPVKNRINHYRNKEGLSQEKLAGMLGFSHRWLSKIENSQLGMRMDDAIKISKILDVTLDELFLNK